MSKTDFELQPHLVGDLVELRPLREEDWDGLFEAASNPLVWAQHPAKDRFKEEVFREFFREALDSGGALAAVDRATQRIVGSSRYFRFDNEIEIGWTFLARSHWGGAYNGEMKRLMLDHAFKFVDRVIFLVGQDNIRSRKAMEKIGGVLASRTYQRAFRGEMIEHVAYEIRKPANAQSRDSRSSL